MSVLLCEDLLYRIADYGGIDLRLRMGLRPQKLKPLVLHIKPIEENEQECWISLHVSRCENRHLVVVYSKATQVRQTWVPYSSDLWRVYYIDVYYHAGFPVARPLVPYVYLSELKRTMRRRDNRMKKMSRV